MEDDTFLLSTQNADTQNDRHILLLSSCGVTIWQTYPSLNNIFGVGCYL